MKIVVACDKYKGSLNANIVCNVIAKAIKDVDSSIEVILNPMADGGEGTVETLVESLGGRYVKIPVAGPLGENINASFGIIENNIAVIEMSQASGLWLVPQEKRNPMETTTYGTGQLISKALDMGCKKIIIGIGGSSTNDGGMGMAQALGVKFIDSEGNLLGFGGKQLSKIDRIDISGLTPLVHDVVFECACDVENPLTGKNGAAYVYAAQKGADLKMIRQLNKGLINFARVIKKDLKKDVSNLKGAGAAGGLGAGLVAFLNAELKAGVSIIIEVTKLDEKIRDCDLIITGEGAFDKQTFFGKSAFGVANLAKKYRIPVITINGSVLVDRNQVSKNQSDLFCGNFSIINKPISLQEAMDNALVLLENQTRELINFFLKIKSDNRQYFGNI